MATYGDKKEYIENLNQEMVEVDEGIKIIQILSNNKNTKISITSDNNDLTVSGDICRDICEIVESHLHNRLRSLQGRFEQSIEILDDPNPDTIEVEEVS
jgi:hypothetical protein